MSPLRPFAKMSLEPRFELRLLGLMLLCLHLAIWFEFGQALSRSLMLAHLGLFLLWQPLWSREQHLDASRVFLFVAVTGCFVYWLNWFTTSVWVLLLTGMVGARVTVVRSDRYAYLASLVFLVSELLLACIPPLAGIPERQREAWAPLGYGLVAVPVGLMLIPARDRQRRTQGSMDFLYGLTTSLLVSVLAMGCLLAMYLGDRPYGVAVTQTILGIALFLLAISWLWSPLGGFSGLGRIWERHIQDMGTPFEQWLNELNELSTHHQRPQQFLTAVSERLIELPWISGLAWSGRGNQGQAGERSPHELPAQIHDLELKLYAQRRLGGVLYLHANLLLQVIGHFYNAKQRELESSQNAHMHAIYETGARVTHDIKNLLQSLHGISVAVQRGDSRDPTEVQALLARQLPHITTRLQLALDKLQAPGDPSGGSTHLADVEPWWEELRIRHHGQSMHFQSRIDAPAEVPVELFDSVAENLLENARSKRQLDADIDIRVDLQVTLDQVRLTVSDTGQPMETEVADNLFRGPVESSNGLGIGLYQAARHAAQLGYALELCDNNRGGVRFRLHGPRAVPVTATDPHRSTRQ